MSQVDQPSLKDGTAYINGQFVPVADARIPILDLGFLHSDATYDVAHVWQGGFFRLEDHLNRFLRSVERLHMSLPHPRERIIEILHECVRLSGLRDAFVEMICTRGLPAPGNRDPRLCKNSFYAFAMPFAAWQLGSPEKLKQGLHLIISDVQRIPETSVDPTVKNYHWLDLVAGLFEAYQRGGETTVLCDRHRNIVEGPGFNTFVVSKGIIATPGHGMLEGITRKTAIEICGMLGIPMEARDVSATEVLHADEIFITSTAAGIVPITKVNGSPVGDGRPGQLTLQVQAKSWSLHQDARYISPIRY